MLDGTVEGIWEMGRVCWILVSGECGSSWIGVGRVRMLRLEGYHANVVEIERKEEGRQERPGKCLHYLLVKPEAQAATREMSFLFDTAGYLCISLDFDIGGD